MPEHFPPETITLIQADYLAGMPLKEIRKKYNIKRRATICEWAKKRGWKDARVQMRKVSADMVTQKAGRDYEDMRQLYVDTAQLAAEKILDFLEGVNAKKLKTGDVHRLMSALSASASVNRMVGGIKVEEEEKTDTIGRFDWIPLRNRLADRLANDRDSTQPSAGAGTAATPANDPSSTSLSAIANAALAQLPGSSEGPCLLVPEPGKTFGTDRDGGIPPTGIKWPGPPPVIPPTIQPIAPPAGQAPPAAPPPN
jgi:hypothetical protein